MQTKGSIHKNQTIYTKVRSSQDDDDDRMSAFRYSQVYDRMTDGTLVIAIRKENLSLNFYYIIQNKCRNGIKCLITSKARQKFRQLK